MIKCNIVVYNYEINSRDGSEELVNSYLEYVVNFPVLPSIGSELKIYTYNEKVYVVLDIEYRTRIMDCHNVDNPSTMEINIIVKEV